MNIGSPIGGYAHNLTLEDDADWGLVMEDGEQQTNLRDIKVIGE